MTLTQLAPAISLLTTMLIALALVLGEHRRLRRIEAGTAERNARPHSVNAGTAAQDAAVIARAALTEQLHHDTQDAA